MMNFHILTLFPEMVMNGLNTSIIGRAAARGLLSIEAVNIRDYAFNKHQSVDDYPYGGGAGMLMQAEPVYLAYKAVEEQTLARTAQAEFTGERPEQTECTEQNVSAVQTEAVKEAAEKKKLRVVYLSPQGDTFSQEMAEELAKEMDMPVDKVREIMKIAQEPVSLETPIGEEEDSHLGDFIPDDDIPAPADAAAFTLLKEQLMEVLDTLTDREKKVLTLRFGLEDGRARTLEEVGKEFNVTRERIRQIEAKALRKLRHPSRSKKLKDYLE